MCKLWYSIAVSTPGLWNLIVINDTTPLSKIDVWLKRSGSVVLEVVIDISAGVEPDKLAAIGDRLLGHVQRLQTFECQVAGEGAMKAITMFMRGHSLPSLRKLGLNDETDDYQDDADEEEIETPILDLFSKSVLLPQLAEVSLWSTAIHLQQIPSANLLKLELSYIPRRRSLPLDNFWD